MLNVCLVGNKGYWGPILQRNIEACSKMRLVATVDPAGGQYKTLHEALEEPFVHAIDAVIIATPPSTHYDLACEAIEAGKHVLIEKPMCLKSERAEDVLVRAEKKGVKVGVDHTFLFSEHIRVIKSVIASGKIGKVLHVSSQRLNLGKFQDSGVIWDLAPHDIALTNYLFDATPVVRHPRSYGHVAWDTPDHSILHMTYPNSVAYTLTLSWLSPRKVRTTTIVGTEGMIEYDMLSDTPVVIYDKKATRSKKEWIHSHNWKTIYEGSAREPLSLLMEEFADYCTAGKEFISDGRLGANVVKTIEQINGGLL